MGRFDVSVCKILNVSPTTAGSPTGVDQRSMVVISSLPSKDEAIAAACILNLKILKDILTINEAGIRMLGDSDDASTIANTVAKCHAGIVMLSSGSLDSVQQLVAMVQLMAIVSESSGADPGVVPVALPDFEFPSPSYFEDAFQRRWTFPGSHEATRHIQAFFKRIAVPFSTSASHLTLDLQVATILSWIPRTVDEAIMAKRTCTIEIQSADIAFEDDQMSI